MSKYGLTQTVLREEKYLVEALKEMGYEVEVHPQGAQLNSYYSEQGAKVANIVIRRQHLCGAFGDIGFARQPDGQLAMIKDELDEHQGYGAKWLGRVQQGYKEKQTLAMARARGYILKGFGMFSGYAEHDLAKSRYWTWRDGTSKQHRKRLWQEIRGCLDFAILGRFNEAQPSVLSLGTSLNQVLRLFSKRYTLADFSEQLTEISVKEGGQVEVTGFPVLGLPW